MKKITITLDEKVLRWAKSQAALQKISLSRFMNQLIAKNIKVHQTYHETMQTYFQREVLVINEENVPYPSREDIYDRNSK